MIEVESLSKITGCRILAKCEHMNPGGSVKDRLALYVIEDAEARGLLKPGGTIVEGSGGNTSIAMAMLATASGYKSIMVVPDKVSAEKIQ